MRCGQMGELEEFWADEEEVLLFVSFQQSDSDAFYAQTFVLHFTIVDVVIFPLTCDRARHAGGAARNIARSKYAEEKRWRSCKHSRNQSLRAR